MKVFPINRISYVDFDVERTETVGVSEFEDIAKFRAAQFQANLTPEEIEREVRFVVGKPIKNYVS